MRVNVVCWLIPEEIQMVTWSRCSHKTSFIKTTPYRHCRIKLSFLEKKKKDSAAILNNNNNGDDNNNDHKCRGKRCFARHDMWLTCYLLIRWCCLTWCPRLCGPLTLARNFLFYLRRDALFLQGYPWQHEWSRQVLSLFPGGSNWDRYIKETGLAQSKDDCTEL